MKNLYMRVTLALAVASATSITPYIASAESNSGGCSCVSGNSVVTTVTAAEGEVIHSDLNGYAVAKPGSILVPGSLVSVGSNSSAVVAFGNQCSINLEANSELLLGTQGGKVCAKVTGIDVQQSNTLAYSADQKLGANQAISQLNASVNPNTVQAQGVLDDTGLSSELIFFGLSGTAFGITVAEGTDDDDDDDNGGAVPATP